MRILLVEDDHLIGKAIEQTLKDNSYAIDWVTDGVSAEATINIQRYDIILLDIGLPGKSGFEVLKAIRQNGVKTPLIFVTARDGIDDRIQGLDLGADDYLVKPFSIDELLARIRAVARRHLGQSSSILQTSDLVLDMARCEVTRDQVTQALSAREFALLQILMMRPGQVCSRESLEEKIYGWNEEVESNAVEFIIHGLRKKLGKDAIKNIRGLGWLVKH